MSGRRGRRGGRRARRWAIASYNYEVVAELRMGLEVDVQRTARDRVGVSHEGETKWVGMGEEDVVEK
jgi:hypothetical protein